MSDNNSLNKKYQKFEPEEEVLTDLAEEKPKKPKKEKKKKEPKASREKKIKEPKEKKIKEPKEKKAKQSKEKKKKHTVIKSEDSKSPLSDNAENTEINEKFAKAYEAALQEEKAEEKPVPESAANEAKPFVQNGRQREEIVFEGVPSRSDKEKKPKKDKKSKAEKAHNKIKEPKENKLKEPKPPKEKKTKKEKPKKEKKQREPLQKKDIATIAVSAVAVILIACTAFFAYFSSRTDEKKVELVSKITFLGKIFPQYVVNSGKDNPENEKNKISEIQIARDGIYVNLMQTDFPGVFYGINSDYTVQYYQYSGNRIVPVKYTDTVNLKVDMGSGILNVKMNYIKSGEYVSGIGVFTSNNNNNDGTNYFYDLVVFKLTVLPAKYNREGHALLLASTDKAALENSNVLWTESFDVNLNNGSMTRFLSVINRTIDEKGAGVADFCILNQAGYTATTQKVPFITSRKYPVGSGFQDIFVKNGNKEELLASDIYGKYLTVDSSKVVYLKKTTTGFDVIHNVNGEERIERSFYGFIDSNYMLNDKYLLSKEDGRLYNIVTGKDYSLVGYSMNAASFVVSSDNRYVIMMGTVKNAVDYQIHIFDLQTGEYAKFKDNNYAPHGTLCFIDEKTVLYTAVEPNQGFEYVVIDIQKAFNKAK